MTQRILLIGGDSGAADRLRAALGTGGPEVDVAAGGVDAVRRLRRKAYVLVVTSPRTSVDEDLAMLDEFRRVRPAVPAILLAPQTTREDVIAAMRAHVFAYFSAPFDWAEIASMVRAAVEETNWRDAIEVLSASKDWLTLRVSSRLLTAERLVQFMRELAADQAGDAREDLITAFRETLLNAMEHGAGFNPEQIIEVSAVRTQRAIVYHFRDPGPGFSRDRLAHASASSDPAAVMGTAEYREQAGFRPGGFGMLLVRQLVDEVIYNEAGNQVILVKHTA